MNPDDRLQAAARVDSRTRVCLRACLLVLRGLSNGLGDLTAAEVTRTAAADTAADATAEDVARGRGAARCAESSLRVRRREYEEEAHQHVEAEPTHSRERSLVDALTGQHMAVSHRGEGNECQK